MVNFNYELTAQIMLSEHQRPIENPGGSSLNIINPFINLVVPFLKTTQNISVSILIFGLDGSNSTQNFEFSITDETNSESKEISGLKGSLPQFDDKPNGINISMDLKNVILENEGKHKAKFLINGKQITETIFYVISNELS